jgi:hypothetical protein
MLIMGDVLVFALITIFGFATHGEAAVSFIPRMGLTILVLIFGWFLLAPWLGLFDETITSNLKMLWRVLLAIFFVVPLAAILRAALLQSTAQPIFVLVLGSTNGLGLLAWRVIYIFISKQNKK